MSDCKKVKKDLAAWYGLRKRPEEISEREKIKKIIEIKETRDSKKHYAYKKNNYDNPL